MNILNLTPHPINILKKEYVYEERPGKFFLRQDCSPENALRHSIQHETTPLNIIHYNNFPSPNGILPFYSSTFTEQDNYGFGAYLQNPIPTSWNIWLQPKFEKADIIIVSQRCTNYINAMLQFPVRDPYYETARLSFLDKFCIPNLLVYKKIKKNNASQGSTRPKVIGALNLQKVINCQPITFYKQAIEHYGLHVSTAALHQVVINYTRSYLGQRNCEYDLQALNNYLIQNGYPAHSLFAFL